MLQPDARQRTTLRVDQRDFDPMGLTDRFSRTNFLRLPLFQSRYRVESAVVQNHLSSSSLLNLGIRLFTFR